MGRFILIYTTSLFFCPDYYHFFKKKYKSRGKGGKVRIAKRKGSSGNTGRLAKASLRN
jgi:hypothetical protein